MAVLGVDVQPYHKVQDPRDLGFGPVSDSNLLCYPQKVSQSVILSKRAFTFSRESSEVLLTPLICIVSHG